MVIDPACDGEGEETILTIVHEILHYDPDFRKKSNFSWPIANILHVLYYIISCGSYTGKYLISNCIMSDLFTLSIKMSASMVWRETTIISQPVI